MKKRTAFLIVAFELCVILPIVSDQKPPVFVFGGKQFYVGMSKHDAVAALSSCCKLSPPAEDNVEKRPAPEGTMLGHMILPKDESQFRILGGIYFSGDKVRRITHP